MRMKHLMIFAAALSAPVAAQPATAPSTRFTAEDLFSLEAASDPQISPDGSQIAFVRRAADIMQDKVVSTIWLIDTASGAMRPLVTGPGSHSQPRWSPDGQRLAYMSTAEAGAPKLFVRWMSNGEAVRVTGLPESPGTMVWSRDGSQIAFSMFVADKGPKLGNAPDKPEGAQWAPTLEIHDLLTYHADGAGDLRNGFDKLFIVPSTGGAARQITFGPYNDGNGLDWSADGETLYFAGNRSPDWELDVLDGEIYALDLATGAVTALTDRNGPDGQPAVSPDGSKIAYIGFDDQLLGYHNAVIYLMDRDGGNKRALTGSLDRSIDTVIWSGDGKALFAQYDDHGETLVARIGLDGSVQTLVKGLQGAGYDRPYTGGSFSASKNGSIAYSGGSAVRPADVMLASNGKTRTLTQLNQAVVQSRRMGDVRKVTAASSFDGRTIEGWLTLPPDYQEGQTVPLILEIHGGPFSAYGPHFSTDDQLYASAGYGVLSVNPRGSTSYGAEFANLIHLKYPGNDYDDLISMVDAVIAQGIADPDALFVTGGSGGGVLTSWIVGKTNRFKAAATQKPVINWTSQVLTADGAPYFSRYWMGAMPWEDPQGYWSRSPLSLVGNVTTPTLVVVGSQDFRTPVSESEQYYTALKLKGVPTMLVKVPGASHGSIAARPSQSGAKASAILDWFGRYRSAEK